MTSVSVSAAVPQAVLEVPISSQSTGGMWPRRVLPSRALLRTPNTCCDTRMVWFFDDTIGLPFRVRFVSGGRPFLRRSYACRCRSDSLSEASLASAVSKNHNG